MIRHIKLAVKVDELINGGQKDGYYAALPIPKQNAVLDFGSTPDEAFDNLLTQLDGEMIVEPKSAMSFKAWLTAVFFGASVATLLTVILFRYVFPG